MGEVAWLFQTVVQLGQRAAVDGTAVGMALVLIGVVNEVVHGLAVIEPKGELSDSGHVPRPVRREQSGKFPEDSRLPQPVLPDVAGWREPEGRRRRALSPGGSSLSAMAAMRSFQTPSSSIVESVETSR